MINSSCKVPLGQSYFNPMLSSMLYTVGHVQVFLLYFEVKLIVKVATEAAKKLLQEKFNVNIVVQHTYIQQNAP